MLFRIRTFNQISPRGLERLPRSRYEVGAGLDEPDAIILRSADLHGMAIPGRLKAVGRAGVGVNNIPVADLSAKGIPVFNAPGANANAVAELVLGMMIAAARNVAPALKFVTSLSPADLATGVEAAKAEFAGIELAQRSLGVVGLGAIGARVAELGARLGMRVIGFDPLLKPDMVRRLGSRVERVDHLDALLAAADFVTLHVPLATGTRHLIGAARVARMRADAILLNFARDAIVDVAAVREALEARRLRAYVCDFPDASLGGEPRAIALPHLGACTAEAEDNCAAMVVDEVRAYLEEGEIRNAVNFPDVEMTRESPHRVSIANANVPNMVGQMSSAMAHAGLNIHNMVNHSRGEMAYTLVDVDSPVDESVVRAIASITGVLAVRLVPEIRDSTQQAR